MASEKQIAANRANAKMSTGPRSHEGKIKSKRNAYKHGLTAEKLVVGEEKLSEFEGLHAGLLHDWRPQGQTEHLLVFRLAVLFWRLNRVPEFESAILNQVQARNAEQQQRERMQKWRKETADAYRAGLEKHLSGASSDDKRKATYSEKKAHSLFSDEQPSEADSKVIHQSAGLALIEDARENDALSKVLRYETTLTNLLSRTTSMLVSLQAMRVADGDQSGN